MLKLEKSPAGIVWSQWPVALCHHDPDYQLLGEPSQWAKVLQLMPLGLFPPATQPLVGYKTDGFL